MNERLLKSIQKSLFKLDGLISTPNYKKNLNENNIDTNAFLNTLKIYIDNFKDLKNKEEILLEILDEQLRFVVSHIDYIRDNRNRIELCQHFMERHKKSFFGDFSFQNEKEPKKEYSIDFKYLENISIHNYFSIKDIEITNLKDKKEIYFVGGNGEGKTILLQAIILALKKEYSGQIIEYIRNERELELFVQDEFSNNYSNNKNIKNVFAYGINRNKTREKFDEYGYSGLFDTSDFKDTTFLKNPLELLRSEHNLVDNFIEKLNEKILMGDLKVEKDNNNKVTFKEKGFEVDFETLSEGYKSTIIWVCDLVSRLIENQKDIKKLADFKAIVLIDEVDLYLHPTWKYDFVYNLRQVFPNIQFIMITHSMVTILGASRDAVFYKVYKENGETKISQPMDSIKNLMANNLSTSPLFDMTTARARNSDDNIDTREDFISSKIHKIIKERVKGQKAIIEDDIEDMINQELDNFLKENGL